MGRNFSYLIYTVASGLLLFSCGGSGNQETLDTEADTVLLMEEAVVTPEPTTFGNLMEVARINGSFTILVQAIEAAGLSDTLQQSGPYTIFAPTDQAFEALPAGRIEDLLKPENKERLAEILKYHVAAGRITSGDLSDGMVVETLTGQELTIHVQDTMIMASDANIVNPDIEADNGVIHVIDQVILPPANQAVSSRD